MYCSVLTKQKENAALNSKIMEESRDDDGRKQSVRDMIKKYSEQSNPIILPKSMVTQRHNTNNTTLASNSDDDSVFEDLEGVPAPATNFEEENSSFDEDEPQNERISGRYLNVPDIIDETKNFIREEESYCMLLKDLVEDYINVLETDKFDVTDVCGRIDLICAFQNNTFLPAVKHCLNVSEIANCFIKHKKLFETYYESYFKNQPNMIFVIKENKEVFKGSHSDEEYNDYEHTLLKCLNERIGSYYTFLESMKNILVGNVDVANFDRALNILNKLIQNFSPKDENIRFVISEIVETERKYIEKLEKITEKTIPKIERLIKGKNRQRSIIGNIPLIYDGQKNFHEALQECLFLSDPNEVAECFLQHKDVFMLYVNDQEMKKNPEAMDECRELLEKEHEKFFDFHVPLNRLYKYRLLLQELIKTSKKGDVPCDKVEEALEMLVDVISRMNGAAAINTVRDENVYLNEQGELVLRNEFIVGDEANQYKAMVFLFEKSIVFTEITIEGLRKNRRDVFLYRDHIIAKYMSIIVKEESPTNFVVKFHGRTRKYAYELRAKDKTTKDLWTTSINDILLQQLRQEKEMNA